MIPVSGNPHTFGGPKNNFVKASHYPQSGHLFVGQPARGTRKNFPPVNWQQERSRIIYGNSITMEVTRQHR
jgi:hypothetical protein